MTPRVRSWFALCLAVVFSAGIGTGLLLRAYIEPTSMASSVFTLEPPSPPELAARIAGEVNLTDEQRQRLEMIIDARRQELSVLRDELQTRIDIERLEVLAEIQAIMTPEQRQLFQAFISRMRPDRRPSGVRPNSPR